jgi:fatty acid desaturase (delta-4 desaturase)
MLPQVLLFGGNDVTAQYKMIHHGHSSNPQHYLSKMALVGEVTDFSCEYKFDTPFEQEIKREVFKIVKRGREFGTPGYLLRAAFYVGLMAFAQLTWVASGSSPLRAVLLGCAGALIGLNVQHDANHGAASKRPWVNEVLGYGADMIGGSKYNWIQQHWTHHAYVPGGGGSERKRAQACV